MNWLDIVLIIVVAGSAVAGLAKGFVRAGLGLLTFIAALFCGLWFCGAVGGYLNGFVSSRRLANLIGFLVVFLGIVIVGALVTALLARLLKLMHLSWLDRLAGGAFGLVRGVLVSALLILLMVTFAPKHPVRAVTQSRTAPYLMEAARAMASAAPREVRQDFREGYEKVKQIWAEALKKAEAIEKAGHKPPEQKY